MILVSINLLVLTLRKYMGRDAAKETSVLLMKSTSWLGANNHGGHG